MGFEELGYGEFPDIKAMALALSQSLDTIADLVVKVHDLESKIENFQIQRMTQTGGFLPKNRII